MADFNWDDHPVESKDAPAAGASNAAFSWDDHPVEEKNPGVLGLIKAMISGKDEDRPDSLKPIDQATNALTSGLIHGGSAGFNDELAGAAASPLGAAKQVGNLFGAGINDQDVHDYIKARNAARVQDANTQQANPNSYMAGEFAGSLVPGALTGGESALGTIGGAALQGAATGTGASDAQSIGDLARDAGTGYVSGAAGGAVGLGIGKALQSGAGMIGEGISKLGSSLGNTAEDLAVKATGATGRQTAKFADDAGRQLLDRGLIKPFDSAGNIAGRVSGASDDAGNAINSALSQLDSKGVTASQKNVVDGIKQQIDQLSKDPSQAGVVRKLRGIIDDISATGDDAIPLTQAESIKRGFNKAAGNWLDPEAGAAGKQAYRGYMNEVERAATEADPALAKQFTEGKQTFGLLAPIQEAAEKRAAQLNQSPFGGLGDFAAGATGSIAGGPGAAATIAARRLVAPRLASTGAVTADFLSKAAQQAPEMLGKFAPVMQSAAQRGSQAVAATHFILESSNPEYREMMKKLQDEHQGDQGE